MRRSVRTLRIVRAVFFLASSLTLAASAVAGDWPQWRGPERDGKSPETGLLQSWPEGGPPLAWRADGLGAGYSSVSVADGRIFTLGSVAGVEGTEDGQYAFALSEDTGELLWKTRVGPPDEGDYQGTRSTPTHSKGKIYFETTRGGVVCLDAESGEELWRRNLIEEWDGYLMKAMGSYDWRSAESPLVDGDKVIVTPGHVEAFLVALDTDTGEEIWKTRGTRIGPIGADGAGYSSPVVSTAAGVRQYVQLLGRGLVGVEAETGRLLWGYNRVANDIANIPTPIVRGDHVFGTSGYGTGAALLKLERVEPDPPEQGEADGEDSGPQLEAREVYFLEADVMQNHHGGVILHQGTLYTGTGHNRGFPLAVDFLGGEVKWGPERNEGTGSAAISYADGRLYLRYQNGLMILVEATPEEYREHGSFMIPDVERESWAHPVIANGRLLLREQNHLLSYDIRAEGAGEAAGEAMTSLAAFAEEPPRDAHLSTSCDAERAERDTEQPPWSYLQGLRRDGSEDPAAAVERLERFLGACPERLDVALRRSPPLGDAGYWRPRLEGFREALGSAGAATRARSLPYLWSTEFLYRPPSEHDALREEIRRDLAALEADADEELRSDGAYWKALLEGREILGDEEELEATRKSMTAAVPCSDFALRQSLDHWGRGGGWREGGPVEPSPNPGLMPGHGQIEPENREAALAALDRIAERCPKSGRVQELRLGLLADEDSDERVVEVVEAYVASDTEASFTSSSPPAQRAADLLIRRGLELERALAFLRALEQADDPSFPSGFPEELLASMQRNLAVAKASAQVSIAEATLELDRPLEAARALSRAAELLAEVPTQPFTDRTREEVRERHDSARAKLAKGHGVQVVAIPAAEEAEAPVVAEQAAENSPASPEAEAAEASEQQARQQARLKARMRAAAAGTKGSPTMSEAAKKTLEPRGEAQDHESHWDDADEALDPFELESLAGKSWTLADFEGRTALINLWATWCAPCIAELPWIQKLHDELADDDDFVVLTFNVDRNPGVVQPFLDKREWSFPVVFASTYLRTDRLRLPQNWIVHDGVKVKITTGFGSDGEAWMDETRALLEATASSSE